MDKSYYYKVLDSLSAYQNCVGKIYGVVPGLTNLYRYSVDTSGEEVEYVRCDKYFGLVEEYESFDNSGESFWLTQDGESMLLLECINPDVPAQLDWEIPKYIDVHLTAPALLLEAVGCLGDRASERDTDSERSMQACIKSFNAMYGKDLTEEEGWMFMVFLKASRAKGGDFRKDDYVDGAAYFALAGEARNE